MVAWNPTQIIAQAQEAEAARVKMDATLNGVEDIVNSIAAVWQDESQTIFKAEYNNFMPEYREFSAQLKSFLEKASSHAEKMKIIGKS